MTLTMKERLRPDRRRRLREIGLTLVAAAVVSVAAYFGHSSAVARIPADILESKGVFPSGTLVRAKDGTLHGSERASDLRDFYFARAQGIVLDRLFESGAVFEIPGHATFRSAGFDLEFTRVQSFDPSLRKRGPILVRTDMLERADP